MARDSSSPQGSSMSYVLCVNLQDSPGTDMYIRRDPFWHREWANFCFQVIKHILTWSFNTIDLLTSVNTHEIILEGQAQQKERDHGNRVMACTIKIIHIIFILC